MIAIEALALATVVRPDGPTPATLERAVRSACVGGWRAVEVVLAGDGLRGRLAASQSGLGVRIEAVFGAFGREIPTRSEALAMLRRARHDGVLDGNLDMAALAAGCGRVGDAPAIAAGRRRVRTLSIDSLRRALADQRALAAALGDGAIAALLVDTARAVFRHASRNDKDLARWAVPPTGTTSRDQALSSFVELLALTALADELDSLIASVNDGTAGAPAGAPPLRSEPSPPVEDAKRPTPADETQAPPGPPTSVPATVEQASSPSPGSPISVPATIEQTSSRTPEPPISVPASVEQASARSAGSPISVPATIEQVSSHPPGPPISVPALFDQKSPHSPALPAVVERAAQSAESMSGSPPPATAQPASLQNHEPRVETASLQKQEPQLEPSPSPPGERVAAAKITAPRGTDEPAEATGDAVRPRRWISLAVVVIAILGVLLFYATR